MQTNPLSVGLHLPAFGLIPVQLQVTSNYTKLLVQSSPPTPPVTIKTTLIISPIPTDEDLIPLFIPTQNLPIPATNLASRNHALCSTKTEVLYTENSSDKASKTENLLVSKLTDYCRDKVSKATPASRVTLKANSANLATFASQRKQLQVNLHTTKRTDKTTPGSRYTKQAQKTAEYRGETTDGLPDSQEDSHLPAMQSAYLTEVMKIEAVNTSLRNPHNPVGPTEN
jgi:hypothetical protein